MVVRALEAEHVRNNADPIWELATVGGHKSAPLRHRAEIEAFVIEHVANNPEIIAQLQSKIAEGRRLNVPPSTRGYWAAALDKVPAIRALRP